MSKLIKSSLGLVIFLLLSNCNFAQIKEKFKIFEIIKTSSNSVPIFSKKLFPEFVNAPAPFNHHIQHLLITNKNIYCFIDGTGVLFQYVDSISKFKRIDSTFFWGYNLGSFAFSYKDGIYNLGGAGLWRSNGHLRKFNFNDHEWDIIPLNKELPIISGEKEGIIYFDPIEGIVFTAYSTYINDGINADQKHENKVHYDVMLLNLNTKKWQRLGNLSNKLIKKGLINEQNIAITPLGLLTSNSSCLSLWNFKENKHFELTNSNPIYQYLKRGIDTTLVYYKHNQLYLLKNNKLDSIKINFDDFRLTGKIYNNSLIDIIKNYSFYIAILGMLAIMILLFLFFKLIKNRIEKDLQKKITDKINSKEAEFIIFKQQELLLLELLILNYKKGVKTTIDEINKTLGLNSRSIETQKSQRHKLITSINETYKNKIGRKLIISDKLDFDRRSNVYFISNEEMDVLLKFIIND